MVSLEEGSLGRAMKCTALEKRSITVRMVVLPSDGGKPVTKSRAMWDQGRLGMGRGRRRPERGRIEVLFWAQVAHGAIKERTSASIVDHQNRRRMKSNVRVIPGWQVSLEEWAQTSTLDRTAPGTNKRLGGPVPGSGCCLCARRTTDSTSQVRVAIKQVGGRMFSGPVQGFSGEYRRDRASGLTFWEPGR